MDVQLPRQIVTYFEADRSGSADAVASCFHEDAVVRDEGEVHSGREAIRRWKATTSARYSYTVEPFAITTDRDRTMVQGHVVGDFPGSSVDLTYVFILIGNKIADLDIVP